MNSKNHLNMLKMSITSVFLMIKNNLWTNVIITWH
jgi:hypothetical protein